MVHCASKKSCTALWDLIFMGFRFANICTHQTKIERNSTSHKNEFFFFSCNFFFSFFSIDFVISDLFHQSFLFLNDITNPAQTQLKIREREWRKFDGVARGDFVFLFVFVLLLNFLKAFHENFFFWLKKLVKSCDHLLFLIVKVDSS